MRPWLPIFAAFSALACATVSAQVTVLSDSGAPVQFIVPLGIDAPAESTAAFRVLAALSLGVYDQLAKVGREMQMEIACEPVKGVAPLPMPAVYPPSSLTVPMRPPFPPSMHARLRYQRGANRFFSPVIIAIADPRASIHHVWPAGADKRAAGCYNCERPEHLRGKTEADGVVELFTGGRTIAVRPAPNIFAGTPYAPFAEHGRMEARVPTVMADTIHPPHALVAANARPLAEGLLQEQVLLHSGELESTIADFDFGGRAGWNVTIERTYRSRVVGHSPLGQGWDANMFKRLRQLPNGDVEYRDGRGEVWLFRRIASDYTAPAGYFFKLNKTDLGWVLSDQRHRLPRFDDLGRLVSETDEFFDPRDTATGNRIAYVYGRNGMLARIVDPVGRESMLRWNNGVLEEITDWRGRKINYEYDAHRRLVRVRLPEVSGERPRIEYAYTSSGPLLTSITDPSADRPRATFSYAEDRLVSERWATGETVTITYHSPTSVAVKDALGQERRYSLTLNDTANLLADRAHIIEQRDLGVPVWSGTLSALTPGAPAIVSTDRVHRFTHADGVLQTSALEGVRQTTFAYQPAIGNLGLLLKSSTVSGGSSPSITRSLIYQSGANYLEGMEAGGKRIQEVEPYRRNTTPTSTNNSITTARTFDAHGLLTATTSSGGTDPVSAGASARIEYFDASALPHARGLPRVIREGDGEDVLETRIEYPSATRTVETDPRGVITTIDRDAWDRIVRVRVERPGDPLLIERTYRYDHSDRLEEVSEKKGTDAVSRGYAYDVMGRLTSTTRTGIATVGSVTTRVAYDLSSRTITTTHPGGAVTKTELDALGRVKRRVTETGSSPIEEQFAYDLAGNQVYATDMFTASASEYDAHGREVTLRAVDGTLATTQYDDWDRPTTVKTLTSGASSTVSESRFAFTDAGRLTSIVTNVDPEKQRTTTFAWDGGGRTTRTSTNGRASAATFDTAGRMKTHAAGAGNLDALTEIFEKTEITGHIGDLPVAIETSEKSGPAYRSTMDRNTTGDVVRENIGPLEWRRTYDELGNVTRATLPGRPATSWKVDARGVVEDETLPDGYVSFFAYDAVGGERTYTDPMSEATSTVRDLVSRPISRTYPDGTTERIEWEGRRVKSVTDRQNRKQSFVYDTKGQLTEIRDGDGALVDLLAYDDAGRLVSWKNAEAEIIWSEFDLDGNPKRTTQRRFKDASGVATSPVVLDQFSQEHHWNEHRERVQFSMPNATSLSRGWTRSVRQSYDAAGNVTSIARIDGDSSTTFMTATYRGAGRPDVRTVVTAGAPIVRTYSYDASSSLLSKLDVSVDSTTVAGSEVAYDGLQLSQSRLLGISSGERSARYSYDPRSRLTASIHGTRSAAEPIVPIPGRAREHMNPADFRTAQERTPVLDPATPGASNVDPPTSTFEEQPGHKIAKATRGPVILPFGYDGAERIDDGRFVYTFDAKGRLIRATEKGSVLPTRRVVYSYSGTGRLVGRRIEYSISPDEWKVEDRAHILAAEGLPAETTFAWDPVSERLLAVYRAGATGDPIKQIIHGDAAYDDPLETTTIDPQTGSITHLYPIYDEGGAGSLQAVLNARGEVVARNLTNDPCGANDVALTGAAIDRVSITATKNADNKLASVVITLHATERLDPTTIAAGSRLAVVDETGTLIRTASVAPTLADPFTITWTLDGSEWQALIDSAPSTASLSIAATTALRASAWSSSIPIMPAPAWALATNRVHTSPGLPVEVRDSLSSLSPHLASIPAGESRTTTSYEAPTLPLLGVSTADTPLDDIVSARMHAHPFTEPMTALNYVRARWYDPGTGTFLSPDPKGYVDSSNLYAYAGGDPVNGRDPTGEDAYDDKLQGYIRWYMRQQTAIDVEYKRLHSAYKRAVATTNDVGLIVADLNILERQRLMFGGSVDNAATYIAFARARGDVRVLTLSFEQIHAEVASDEAVRAVGAAVVGGFMPHGPAVRQSLGRGSARVASAYSNSILSSEIGAVGPKVTNRRKSALTPTTRPRDAQGRFVTDPENPPSPFVFTDAQRRAAWKKLAEDPASPLTPAERAEIKARGWRGPQRYNEYGELETMELSHEPVPLREGGSALVPRWPSEHAQVDPFRHLKKR